MSFSSITETNNSSKLDYFNNQNFYQALKTNITILPEHESELFNKSLKLTKKDI